MASTVIDIDHATHVGLADAKTNLSGLIAEVERSGEPCVIMRYNRPAAMIAPLPEQHATSCKARGMLAAFADPSRIDREADAFRQAIMAKHA